MIKKKHPIILFTSDVIYKKNKRLVLTPKKSAFFIILASLLDKGIQAINYSV